MFILQSFYSNSVMNPILKGLKKEDSQTIAKNVQILFASGYASNIGFPIVQKQFHAIL